MTKVKICGNSSLEDARAALSYGADAVGFVAGLAEDSRRRSLTAANIAAIVAQLPAGTQSVLVTTTKEPDALVKLAADSHVKTLQLHGPTTPEEIREIKKSLPDIMIWKAITGGGGALERAKSYEGVADLILLDSSDADTHEGGTGKTHDWNASRSVVEAMSSPVILAGGLTPENVADAVREVRPYMVDVNSGVSNADGTKDLEKIKLFIERAKRI